MVRVYAYIRVSSRGQADEDKDGFPRQRETIAKFAAANDLEIVGEFAEKITGKTESIDRPQFGAMLDCIAHRRDNKSDIVDIVVVERQDRLARDLLIGELLLETCRKQRIKVYSADQGLIDIATDDTDPTRILIRQIMGALAQWDRSTLVRKLRSGRERSARAKGVDRVEGRPPYGSLPGEPAILQIMLSSRALGDTFQSIADELSNEGFLNRAGKLFNRRNVFEILKYYNKQKERQLCTAQQQSDL